MWEVAGINASDRWYHSPLGERKKMAEEKKEKKAVKTKVGKESPKKTLKKEEVVDEKELLKKADEKEKVKKETEEKQKTVKKAEKKIEKVEAEQKIEEIRAKNKHGKKYRTVKEKIKIDKIYEPDEAINLAKETSVTKFDATVDLHLRIDKKIENLRGVVNLPAGTAKDKKVLEVTEKNVEEVVEKVKAGKAEFDIMLAIPAVMPKLASLAKILGPKGLMPNPKSGTVTENITEAAEEFRGGKLEFKADKGNNIHISIGRVSFERDKLKENLDAVLAAVPIGKVLSAHLTTSMGPSIRIKVGK